VPRDRYRVCAVLQARSGEERIQWRAIRVASACKVTAGRSVRVMLPAYKRKVAEETAASQTRRPVIVG
jgi:hypothetical protein